MKNTFLAFLVLAPAAMAEGVYLRNSHSRMIYGPVMPGTRLEMAAGRDGFMREPYDCEIPSPAETQVVSNLQAVVLPVLRFTNAPITDVVGEINRQMHQAGATSLTVKVDLEGYQWRKDVPVICSLSEDSRTNMPAVSLVWRYVSLFTILEGISRMTDLPVNVVGKEIILSQKTKQQLSNNERVGTSP